MSELQEAVALLQKVYNELHDESPEAASLVDEALKLLELVNDQAIDDGVWT